MSNPASSTFVRQLAVTVFSEFAVVETTSRPYCQDRHWVYMRLQLGVCLGIYMIHCRRNESKWGVSRHLMTKYDNIIHNTAVIIITFRSSV